MENKAYAYAAGLFLLVLGLALAATINWFQGDRVERVRYTVLTQGSVPGLNLKAPVKLRGVEVGKVDSIDFDAADMRRIRVGLLVDRAAPVTTATYAQLGLQGVTGLSFINLEDGTGAAAAAPRAADGATIPLRPTLLDRLAESGPGLLAGFAESAQRLNALLAEDKQQRLVQSLAQIGSAADAATRLMAELRPVAQALPALLRHADGSLSQADAALRNVDSLAQDSRGLAQDLRSRAALLDKLGEAALQVQASTRRLETAVVGNSARNRPLVDELGAAGAAVERASGALADQPQSLIFGRTAAAPGPGEAGFEDRMKAGR